MKHKRLLLAGLFCLFCSLITLISCKKNAGCTGVIFTHTVNEQTGVKTPIGGCKLVIGDTTFADDIYREVVTDASGYYEGKWSREVYLLVEATKDLNEEEYYYGIGYIHLETGNTTELSIPLGLKKH